jgi:16S rRNA processing protein RimM
VVVVKMVGVDSREDTEAYRQMSVFADAEDLPPLEEDEFFIHDLVGLDVSDEDGGAVGTVTDVLHLPAQDVLVVSRSGREPAMIPVVDEFIVDIDVEARRIVVRPIEGLL